MPHLRRAFGIALVSSAFVWLGSAAAFAAGNPDRTPAPPFAPYTALLCGAGVGDVTVSLDADTYRSYVKTYVTSDGTTRLKFNGYQAATVTGNGKTLHFNISGPGTIVLNGDTVVAVTGTGHGLYIGPPGTTQPGLLLFTGNVVYAVESSGNAIVASYTGHRTDICALLRG
jgi:hypothetical protein